MARQEAAGVINSWAAAGDGPTGTNRCCARVLVARPLPSLGTTTERGDPAMRASLHGASRLALISQHRVGTGPLATAAVLTAAVLASAPVHAAPLNGSTVHRTAASRPAELTMKDVQAILHSNGL